VNSRLNFEGETGRTSRECGENLGAGGGEAVGEVEDENVATRLQAHWPKREGDRRPIGQAGALDGADGVI
jgi:hypothetical protein